MTVSKHLFAVLCFSIQMSAAQAASDTLSIIGVGDLMLGTAYPSETLLPPNQGKHLLEDVSALLKDADVTFGNLEGAVANSGTAGKIGCTNCFSFRMPENLIPNLVDAGFDVLSIANNHARDFGISGQQNTMKVLDSLQLYYAGPVEHPSVVFTKDGVKYGFAAFAPHEGMSDLRDIDEAKRIISDLRKQADIVLVSFHAGAEGRKNQHVTRKTEFFYSENRGNVYEFAHAAVDAGADIVFGHGPHVTRAAELYKNRFIAYSLGNFCTYGPFNLKEENGFAPLLKVHVKRNGEFDHAEVVSIKQEKNTKVLIDKQHTAFKLLKTLTQADFPETTLNFSEVGIIK